LNGEQFARRAYSILSSTFASRFASADSLTLESRRTSIEDEDRLDAKEK
jgi:hypothetical protein